MLLLLSQERNERTHSSHSDATTCGVMRLLSTTGVGVCEKLVHSLLHILFQETGMAPCHVGPEGT